MCGEVVRELEQTQSCEPDRGEADGPAPGAGSRPTGSVRRETRPDIPDTIGKNLEGDSWIIVPTWSRKVKGKVAYTKSVDAPKMFKSRRRKIRALWLRLIA